MKKSVLKFAAIALIAMIFTSCGSNKPASVDKTEDELRAQSDKMQEKLDTKEEHRGLEK